MVIKVPPFDSIHAWLAEPYIDGEMIYNVIESVIRIERKVNLFSSLTDPVSCFFCELIFKPLNTDFGHKMSKDILLYGLYYPCVWVGVGGGESSVCWNVLNYHD